MRYCWRLSAWLAVCLGLVVPGVARPQPAQTAITVFAASDLTAVFRVLIPEFEQMARIKITFVPGSTGVLTQQLRNGAPADLFFAANEAAIDDLAKEGLTLPATRAIYARGALVVVKLKSNGVGLNTLRELADPKIRRVAIANPAHAPYGLAAQQALQAAGLWTAVQPKLVYGENIQQAIQFVQSGSVDAGIVARSLVENSKFDWKPVDQSLHAPLNQTAIVLARAKRPDVALAFLNFVKGDRGRAMMKRVGFLIPGEDF